MNSLDRVAEKIENSIDEHVQFIEMSEKFMLDGLPPFDIEETRIALRRLQQAKEIAQR